MKRRMTPRRLRPAAAYPSCALWHGECARSRRRRERARRGCRLSLSTRHVSARAAALPSKLSERILFGSTASASDAKSLKALGVTHIVSLVNDPAFTVPPNTPPFRHLRVRAGGVARERGTRRPSIAPRRRPSRSFLAAIESSNGEKVLIHAQAATGPTAAAAIACAALVADGASELSVAAAAARLESVRTASALHDDRDPTTGAVRGVARRGAPPSGCRRRQRL